MPLRHEAMAFHIRPAPTYRKDERGALIMARIRTIKPEFWTDEAISSCSIPARLMFVGTWNFADDEGNLEKSFVQLKAKIFPIDSIDVRPLMAELLTHGLLIEYSLNGKNYLHIKGFSKHQLINRPSAPQCPVYEDSMRTHGVFNDDSLPKGREGREGKDIASRKRISNKTSIPEDFTISERVISWANKNRHSNLEKHFENFVGACKAKNYQYADWDEAFMGAIRKDWAKLNTSTAYDGGMVL